MLTTAFGAWLLWLASVSPGLAAPAPTTVKDAASAHGRPPIAFKLKNLVHQSRLVRGRAAKRFRLALFDLKHRTQKMGGAAHAGARDDDQAIQNDAPATEIAIAPFAGLQPLGFFVESSHRRTFVVPFSPRSPRGPPTHV